MEDIESFTEADTMESIIFDDDYKKGMEHGMQQSYMSQSRTSPARSHAYEAGYQHGREIVARILQSSESHEDIDQKIHKEIQRLDAAEDDELESIATQIESAQFSPDEPVRGAWSQERPRPCYMEDEGGVPEEYLDPVESNTLEQSLLKEQTHGLTFKLYIRNGYAAYLKWLADKLLRSGLREHETDHIYFMVAADINQIAKQQYNSDEKSEDTDELPSPDMIYPMGEDVYAVQVLQGMPRAQPEEQRQALMEKLEWTEDEADEFLKSREHIDTKLDLMEFYRRLKKVPDHILDKHSKLIWRGTNGTITGREKITLTRKDMQHGMPFAPSTGFHLGMRMLEVNGFIEKSPDMDTPRSLTREITLA